MICRKSLKKGIAASAVAGAVFFSFMLTQPAVAQAEEEDDGGHIIPHEIGKLNISGGITSILQGTNGIADNGDVTDFTYTLDLIFEAGVTQTGKVVVALEAGNGSGVNDPLNALSTPNYDAFITELSTADNAFASISVSQAYYEGNFLDGQLGLRVGKLDVHSCHDENAYANDETDQFITGMFTRYAGSIFPELDSYYAPGISLTYSPAKVVDITLTAANGVGSGFDDITSNAYGAGQVNIKPGLFGREGNYRFYYIYDARNYTDISDPTKTDKTNTGFGLSFDQEVIGGLGLFVRYAAIDDGIDQNLVKSAISGGVSLNGSFWNRDNDVIGIAAGVLAINDQSSGAAANPDDEGHIEAYYKIGFSDHFTLTPDVQVITNAGGNADIDTITVFGLRAQMNF
ncbi:MAG: carbohydrate porin [Nitrospirae bacterium]|nr:carbohydrate porin [Nitrospirota bacterium]